MRVLFVIVPRWIPIPILCEGGQARWKGIGWGMSYRSGKGIRLVSAGAEMRQR